MKLKHKGWILLLALIALCLIAPVLLQVYGYWQAQRAVEDARQRAAQMNQLLKVFKAKLTPEQLRDSLADDYKKLIGDANPSLNFIEVYSPLIEAGEHKGHFALYAQHSYLNQDSFKAGPLVKFIRRWIEDNRDDLKRADVVKVGVRSDFHSTDVSLRVE